MKNFILKDYLKNLETVVNIDSGHHHEPGTNAVADFFIEKYRELGFIAEKKYDGDDRTAPFVTVRNTDSEKIDVLMIGHMDTVFPVGTAAERPFSIDEAGHGRGPGCIDCKGGCMLMYYLLKAMKEAGEINFSFCVAMNSDEETGSKHSRYFFEDLADISGCCLVFEPGRANWEFVKQRKGGGNYTVKCHGIAAHSGVCPEKGASAIVELAKWIPLLQEKYFLLDEGTTINIGRFDGGSDSGQVPDYAEFTISLRTLTNETLNKYDKEIMDIPNHPFDKRCTLEIDRRLPRPAMAPDENTFALISLFEEAAKETDQPCEMLVTGGGSDGNWTAARGCPTVDGCGPCGAELHTKDEYLIIESIEKRLELMRLVLLKRFGK